MPLSLTPLPSKDAIAYFRQKGLKPAFDFRDVWQDEHAKAFTVAKAMSVDILEDIRGAIDDALVKGTTFEQFKQNLTPILQAKGWWGKKEMTDPVTGKTALAQLGSDRRLKTIFQTNMKVSYAVGNWQRAWATRDTFPYMQYQHNADRFPRPQHVAWSGICLPIDDPWWKTHYPPCAWGCNCSVNSLSKRMLDQRGIEVTQNPPKFPPKTYVNARTGEVSQVEEGIDPAWNYNVGMSPLRGLMARPGAAPAHVSPVPVDVLKPVVDQFVQALGAGAEGRIMQRDGWPLAVGEDMFMTPSNELVTPRPDLIAELPLVADAIKNYDHVEWLWGKADSAGGNVVMIRRYTKALDNRIITVDFSDGMWTYDVQPKDAP